MMLNNLIGLNNAGSLRNVEYPFIGTLSGPLCHGVVAPDRVPSMVLSMGQIELFSHFTVSKQMINIE